MLGERIAAVRSKLGWSQAELARRLNISPSTVGMYEQGRREPSIEMVVLLSEVLGVSTEFLV
jgi:transcriptional regulator with XRE-family HTH domain